MPLQWRAASYAAVNEVGARLPARPPALVEHAVMAVRCCICILPQVPDLVTEYQKGTTMLDKYVTHNMKFDQINEAFELLHAGECLRCVLTF